MLNSTMLDDVGSVWPGLFRLMKRYLKYSHRETPVRNLKNLARFYNDFKKLMNASMEYGFPDLSCADGRMCVYGRYVPGCKSVYSMICHTDE